MADTQVALVAVAEALCVVLLVSTWDSNAATLTEATSASSANISRSSIINPRNRSITNPNNSSIGPSTNPAVSSIIKPSTSSIINSNTSSIINPNISTSFIIDPRASSNQSNASTITDTLREEQDLVSSNETDLISPRYAYLNGPCLFKCYPDELVVTRQCSRCWCSGPMNCNWGIYICSARCQCMGCNYGYRNRRG